MLNAHLAVAFAEVVEFKNLIPRGSFWDAIHGGRSQEISATEGFTNGTTCVRFQEKTE